jgi:L-arabinose isomerase
VKPLEHLELWFSTGSQHLHGDQTLRRVDAHAREIAGALDAASEIPVRVIHQPVVESPEAIPTCCCGRRASRLTPERIGWQNSRSVLRVWQRSLSFPLLGWESLSRAT